MGWAIPQKVLVGVGSVVPPGFRHLRVFVAPGAWGRIDGPVSRISFNGILKNRVQPEVFVRNRVPRRSCPIIGPNLEVCRERTKCARACTRK